MSRPKGSKNKPRIGAELKDGVIPEPEIINEESLKKCDHSAEHHGPDLMCNSCGCLRFNGCGK